MVLPITALDISQRRGTSLIPSAIFPLSIAYLVAVTMGFLTSPGRLHQPALGATNFAVTMMPLVLIPTIPVPLSIVAHLVDLHRLAGRAQPRMTVHQSASRSRSPASSV